MSGVALLTIAKAPVAGQSKTRLCPPCTPSQAAMLAEAALADTLVAVAATPALRRILVLDGVPGDWLPSGFEVVSQCGGGLGDRLGAAFEAAGGPAVLVGMDTPQITPGLLTHAAAELETPGVDAVLGAAPDGGYWTIGLRRPVRGVFRDVPMSSPLTLAAQRLRLRALGLRWRELAQLRDVDTIADARAVAATAPHSRFADAMAALALGEARAQQH